VSIDIAAELRSWCIDHHLPSGASECLFCEAAQTIAALFDPPHPYSMVGNKR